MDQFGIKSLREVACACSMFYTDAATHMYNSYAGVWGDIYRESNVLYHNLYTDRERERESRKYYSLFFPVTWKVDVRLLPHFFNAASKAQFSKACRDRGPENAPQRGGDSGAGPAQLTCTHFPTLLQATAFE